MLTAEQNPEMAVDCFGANQPPFCAFYQKTAAFVHEKQTNLLLDAENRLNLQDISVIIKM